AIAFVSRFFSVGERPSMLSSREIFAGFLVGFCVGFLVGVVAVLGGVVGVGGVFVVRRDGVGVTSVVGGSPIAGAPTVDTTGVLSAPRPSTSVTCPCHSSNDPTTAPTPPTPITDSNRVRAAPSRRGGRSSLMGYSLSDRGGGHIGPRDRSDAPSVAPEYQFGRRASSKSWSERPSGQMKLWRTQADYPGRREEYL